VTSIFLSAMEFMVDRHMMCMVELEKLLAGI